MNAPSSSVPGQAVSTHPSGNVKLNPRENYAGDDACRSCHQDRVDSFHRTAHYLTSALPDKTSVLGSFSPDANILKAWCHAGHGVPVLPAFSYIPGEPLDKYLELPQPEPDAPIDVHGSQVELLKKSRCFQSSTMTCLTCHDVHMTQKDLAAFSAHCVQCHKVENHPKMSQPIANNCVDCHMPKQQTNLIVFSWGGRKVSPEVRNHWIKIYPAGKVSPALGEQNGNHD